MNNLLCIQFIALSLYIFCMGFCFCDGFGLSIIRKLIWFAALLAISVYVFYRTHTYSLELILPIPSLLAILLCKYEKIKKQKVS